MVERLKLKILPVLLLCSVLSFPLFALKSNSHLGGSNEGASSFEGFESPEKNCKAPRSTTGLAVDTDGGDKNGSETHQSKQSYQADWGGTIDPSKVLGAVNTENNGLKGGDLICYKNEANNQAVCGVVFDNAYSEGQGLAKNKNGNLKPQEATVPIHKVLGASSADGKGTSLSETHISTQPIRLSEADRQRINNELKLARQSQSYEQVNRIIQEVAKSQGCLSFDLTSSDMRREH